MPHDYREIYTLALHCVTRMSEKSQKSCDIQNSGFEGR